MRYVTQSHGKIHTYAKMMNLVAVTLVVASLAGAGVFSPTPHPQARDRHAERTIIKEGHRVVVVEYDQDDHHNTKISIKPQLHDEKFTDGGDYSGALGNDAREKIKEAASVLPNMGGSQDQGVYLRAPRGLICDANGKCKHKIADAMGKAKETAREVVAEKKDMAREVGETVADSIGRAKDTASHKARNIQEKTKGAVRDAKETGNKFGETIADRVSYKARDVQEKAKDTLRDAKDTGNKFGEHVSGNVSKAVENVRSYLGSRERLDDLMGVSNLLGFATAYGLCVWVTFISSYVLSGAMPRQQFGVVQSKIYPVYFRVMAYSVGLALLGHVLGHRKTVFLSKPEMLQVYNLLASLITVFVNSVYLEPRATKVMFERMKIEKEGRGRGDFTTEPVREGGHQHTAGAKEPATTIGTSTGTATAPAAAREAEPDPVRSRISRLNEKLKKLNSYSSLLNMLNLMSLTWHLVYLAQRLNHKCCTK